MPSRRLDRGLAGAWLASCRPRSEALGDRVDRALGAAMRSLIAAQSPDGAWRSSTYGVFKDGLSLTPTVLKAVAFGPDVDGSAMARRRGAEYLIGRVRADGSIDGGRFGMTYPVYTASAAVITLTVLDFPDGRQLATPGSASCDGGNRPRSSDGSPAIRPSAVGATRSSPRPRATPSCAGASC